MQSETPPLALQLKNLNLLVPKVKSSRLSSPLRFKFRIRSASYNNTHDSVKEMQQTTITKPTTTLAGIARLQAPTAAKPKDRPPARTKTPVPEPSSSEAPTPELRGDFALFGRPSVVGGFNLTTGILVNMTFTVLLLASAGLGTWQRANSRRLLRQEMDQAGFIEAGYSSNASAHKRGRDSSGGYDRRGATDSGAKVGGTKRYAISGRGSSREEIETSHAASTPSFSGRQGLTGHVGPKATITSSDPKRSRSKGASGTNGVYKERSPRQNRRAEAQAGPSVRFGNERKDFQNARTGNSQMQHGLKKSPLGGMRYGNGANRPDHLRQRNQDDYRKDSMDDRIHVNFNLPVHSTNQL
ncbi:hypothetical protein BGZ67_007072 [Mortierella alpina]|nr:hypothetical protein BGZ67_007072 [Mortierella alpina]